jgi:general secretion pathway protein I
LIDRRQQQGFSLLEVLVAFAILSLSLGVLFQIFSSGVRGTIVSEGYNKALIIAQSRLAEVGVDRPLEAGMEQGEAEEPYRWRVEVTPYQEGDLGSQRRRVEPYRIDVWVGWKADGKARDVELSTLRLGKGTG